MKALSVKAEPKERLYSLDTLRGFDMFWIMGAEALIISITKASGWSWLDKLAIQMHHVPWNGFHFYDLIFPLFMFISGVAIPFALTSKLEKGVAKIDLTKKVLIRMLLLVVFGFAYNGALQKGFSDMRAASVLAQIGISYAFAAFIVLNTSSVKQRIFWLLGIWSFIAVLQLFIPVPGYGAGVFTPEGSINAWIDQHFLPGRFHFKMYDPEGILCIVSATTVTLMGTFAGSILRNQKINPNKKTMYMLMTGVCLVIAALVLSIGYPIIKNIWTVPFTMLTAGISFLLLALFYYIIDVKEWRKWTFFFRIIGLNSITIYLGKRILDFQYTSEFLFGWLANSSGDFGRVVIISGLILIEWLFLYYLFKNKIFLRV